MAAKKNPLSDKAHELYKSGMKLVEIAARLEVPPGTVRRWKSTYGWEDERSESKSERSDKRRTKKKIRMDDGTRDTLQNEDLTPEQQLFCVYYSRTFNATQSYLKAYKCRYDVANAEGYRHLVNPCIKAEIDRLKELKRQQIVADAEDIVEIQMRIAFADMGDYVTFGSMGVDLQESALTDTQMIQEIKEGKNGISIKLSDRQKAIDWLTRYFLMHPESRYKADYERRRAEKEGGETQEFESDGFLEALKGEAAATFEGDDIVET